MEVRSQGAQVNGNQAGPLTTINVDSPGAVVATNTLAVGTSSTTRSCSSVTGSTVVVGGPGFGSVNDDERISIASPLPTIYEDAEGAASKTNPLTTDAYGLVECWIVGGKYDLLATIGSTLTLYTDVATTGGESSRSNVYNGGSSVAWIWDCLRALISGDKIASFRNAGVEKASIAHDGAIAGAAISGAAISGTTGTFSGAVSGATTVAAGTTVTAGTGVTATTGNVQATAGDLVGRRLVATKGDLLVAGDFAISAGWGSTGSIAVTSTARDQRGGFGVTAGGAGIAADPTVTLTFADGVFPEIPVGLVVKAEIAGIAPTTAYWVVTSTSTGAITFTFIGTPITGSTYSARYAVIG